MPARLAVGLGLKGALARAGLDTGQERIRPAERSLNSDCAPWWFPVSLGFSITKDLGIERSGDFATMIDLVKNTVSVQSVCQLTIHASRILHWQE